LEKPFLCQAKGKCTNLICTKCCKISAEEEPPTKT
jgi:hypothetical protein